MRRFESNLTNTSRVLRTVLATSLLLALNSVSSARAAVEESDQQFVDGLRQRRLFSLAETFCLERLDTL